jgi:predicted metal-dependent phosphoesterase TrpH
MHVHSKYSSDSTIPIRDIVHSWKHTGILPLVCDHNSVNGSIDVYREIRQTNPEIPEILAEEILTSEGEIIGAFLQEEIPALLSAEETLDRIRDQGAISLVPHPFCSFRTSVIRPDVLDRVAGRVDIIEGFNGRAIDERDNTYARRYAVVYGKPVSAGSDAHTAGELGRTYTGMEPFDSPKGLLRSIRSAEIHYQTYAPVLRLSKKSIPRYEGHFGPFPEPVKKCLGEEL